jgi:hypothetical protein
MKVNRRFGAACRFLLQRRWISRARIQCKAGHLSDSPESDICWALAAYWCCREQLPPSVSRLSTQCGILNISQSTACYRNSFTFFVMYSLFLMWLSLFVCRDLFERVVLFCVIYVFLSPPPPWSSGQRSRSRGPVSISGATRFSEK